MEQNQTSTKQVIMDAEVLDMLIGKQDYSKRLRKYSFKLQVTKVDNPVTKVSKYYFVTNTSDETIIIIGEGPNDLIKNRDNLYLTSDNKILFKLPASEGCILTHNEFMWLSCQPEISFIYSNGKINTLYNEDELEGMDPYNIFSQLEFQPTSEPEVETEDEEEDDFDEFFEGLEEEETDDGPVQITYQEVDEISSREYIYSDEDEEYLTDEEFEEIEAELEAEEANKNFNLTVAEYKKACCGGTLAEACIKELLEKVVDNLIQTELNTKLHKYSNSLHVTKLFSFNHGTIVPQAYKIENISNETVWITGGDVGSRSHKYKMIRKTDSDDYEFRLNAKSECILNIDEFIWLCVQPEITFKFSNGYLRDNTISEDRYALAYQIIKDNFTFFFNG